MCEEGLEARIYFSSSRSSKKDGEFLVGASVGVMVHVDIFLADLKITYQY